MEVEIGDISKIHLLRFSIKHIDTYVRVYLRKFIMCKCLKRDNSVQNYICNSAFLKYNVSKTKAYTKCINMVLYFTLQLGPL